MAQDQPDPHVDGKLAFINGAMLKALVPMTDAIELVSRAMIDLSNGGAIAPERWAMALTGEDKLGIMPGAMPERGVFGVKLISLFKGEARPSHQGLMMLFDLASGAPAAVLDGAVLTGLRTAAASAAATRALALPGANAVALLGCGEQAAWHVEAMLAVRPITEFHLWSRTPASAESLADDIRSRPGVSVSVHANARDAAQASQIVCTLSASKEPILEGDWLKSGQHVNLVGSSTRLFREIDERGVARGYYVADERAHALSQAGEFRRAVETCEVAESHLQGEIGEILAGRRPGRTDETMVTIYKSLGHSVQDLAVAKAALTRGRERGAILEFAW